jgi:hypothetical protein
MRLWCDAMWGIIRRDAILFVSYRSQLISQFLGPLFMVAVFYYISRLLTAKTIHSSGGYFRFVIIGLMIVQILTISLGRLILNSQISSPHVQRHKAMRPERC